MQFNNELLSEIDVDVKNETYFSTRSKFPPQYAT